MCCACWGDLDVGQTTAVTRTEGWQIVRKGAAVSGLGEQREHAVGERSELHSSGGSRALGVLSITVRKDLNQG